MLRKFSVLVLILGLGTILALYFFVLYPANSNPQISTSAKISTADAIRIIENDIDRWNRDYGPDYQVTYRITDIAINRTSIAQQTLGYVSLDEFNDKNMRLPLAYIHPNRTVLLVSENGYYSIGECNTGLSTYCGYLWPLNFDYKGRLVYGAELLASENDNAEVPLLYIVDAMNGEIVDSTFLRIQHDIKPPT